MRIPKFLKYGLAAVAVVVLAIGQAAPAGAVTFSFSNSTGWVLGAPENSVVPGSPSSAASLISGLEFFGPSVNPDPTLHPGDNAPPPNTFTTVGWGCNLSGTNCTDPGLTNIAATNPHTSASRSSLLLVGQAGTIEDDGVFHTISHLEHNNTAISGQTLSSILARSFLRLSTSEEFENDSTNFITFTETLNSGLCPPPNPQGSKCDDFFGFDFADFSTPIVFEHDGQLFQINFQLANLTNATLIPFGDAGFVFTAEGVTSSLDVQMAITRVVPEPATLLLLGTGLVGVGIAAAKRARRKQ